MPAYNEAELLETSVAEVVDGLRTRGLAFEVVVVENGSRDETPAIADQIDRKSKADLVVLTGG